PRGHDAEGTLAHVDVSAAAGFGGAEGGPGDGEVSLARLDAVDGRPRNRDGSATTLWLGFAQGGLAEGDVSASHSPAGLRGRSSEHGRQRYGRREREAGNGQSLHRSLLLRSVECRLTGCCSGSQGPGGSFCSRT